MTIYLCEAEHNLITKDVDWITLRQCYSILYTLFGPTTANLMGEELMLFQVLGIAEHYLVYTTLS